MSQLAVLAESQDILGVVSRAGPQPQQTRYQAITGARPPLQDLQLLVCAYMDS